MLAISTESWHFAYYKWIRSLYGVTDVPDRTSLCPYCQTIIWGSIFCVLCSPLLVIGWMMMRFGRWTMKLEGVWSDKLLSSMDNTLVGHAIDQGPSNFDEAPIVSGIMYTLMGTVVIAGLAVVVGVALGVLGALGWGAWNVEYILNGAWSILCSVGSFAAKIALNAGFVVFHICGAIGRFLNWIAGCLCDIFTDGVLWLTILDWATYLIIIGIVGIIVGYTAMRIAQTKIFNRIWNNIVTRANGFAAARESRKERVRALCRAQLENAPPVKCYHCGHSNPATGRICEYCDWYIRPTTRQKINKWVNELFDKTYKVMDKWGMHEIHLLGWVGICWEFVKALKRGVCPFVEFTTPSELQNRATENVGSNA